MTATSKSLLRRTCTHRLQSGTAPTRQRPASRLSIRQSHQLETSKPPAPTPRSTQTSLTQTRPVRQSIHQPTAFRPSTPGKPPPHTAMPFPHRFTVLPPPSVPWAAAAALPFPPMSLVYDRRPSSRNPSPWALDQCLPRRSSRITFLLSRSICESAF